MELVKSGIAAKVLSWPTALVFLRCKTGFLPVGGVSYSLLLLLLLDTVSPSHAD
jgi:hypothetical protein